MVQVGIEQLQRLEIATLKEHVSPEEMQCRMVAAGVLA
jgi:hypothetical protein